MRGILDDFDPRHYLALIGEYILQHVAFIDDDRYVIL